MEVREDMEFVEQPTLATDRDTNCECGRKSQGENKKVRVFVVTNYKILGDL